MGRYGFQLVLTLGIVISAFITGCKVDSASPEPAAQPPPIPSINQSIRKCTGPYDVTLEARQHIAWPTCHGKKCDRDSFWDWFLKHKLQKKLAHPIVFDPPNKIDLAKVHLTHATLTLETIGFNIDDTDFDHVSISLNGFKGSAIGKNAVTLRVLETLKFPKAVSALARDLIDTDEDGFTTGLKEDGDDDDDEEANKKGKKQGVGLDRIRKFKTVQRVEIAFHLEKFVFGVNTTAAELIRQAAISDDALTFKIRHTKGIFRTINRKLHLKGTYFGTCVSPAPEPSKAPSPMASPSPQASPSASPYASPSSSPMPAPSATASPVPSSSPSPIPNSSPSPQPAPVVTIDSASVGLLTNNSNIQIFFSANQSVTFKCNLDQVGYDNCISPFNVAQLSDGPHHFGVEAKNSEGTVGLPAHFDWVIDTMAPTVAITSYDPSTSPTSRTDKTIAFTSNETSTFECRQDSGNWSPCSSPMTFNNLNDGTHQFDVRSIDLIGNIGLPESHQWTVKTVAPTVTITGSTPSTSLSNLTSKEVSFTGSIDTASFECSLDDKSSVTCTSPYLVSGLSDGAHKISIWGLDAAGNRSAPAILSFAVDSIHPNVVITTTIPSQLITSSMTMEFGFSADESSHFSCSLDSSSFAACTSPQTFFGLSDGLHIFEVFATDLAGNNSSVLTYKWTVDTIAPTLSLQNVDPIGALINQDRVTLAYSVSESGSILCSLDSAAAVDCSSGVVNYSGLANANHTVTAQAFDEALNASAPVTYSFTVDTNGPIPQITSVSPNSPITNSTSLIVNFTSNESGTFICQLDGGASGSCTSPLTFTNLNNGAHIFSVWSRDMAGNISQTAASYSWTVDTVAPHTTISTTTTDPTSITSATFSLSASEAATFDCTLDGVGPVACTSPVSYNGLADGTHFFEVHSTDLAGNRDVIGANFTWTVSTQVLTISNFRVDNITKNSATISWTTNLPSDSQVAYALGAGAYQFTPVDSNLTTTHTVQLTGLTSFGLYTVYGISNGMGQTAQSSTLTFRTLR